MIISGNLDYQTPQNGHLGINLNRKTKIIFSLNVSIFTLSFAVFNHYNIILPQQMNCELAAA